MITRYFLMEVSFPKLWVDVTNLNKGWTNPQKGWVIFPAKVVEVGQARERCGKFFVMFYTSE